MEEATPEVYNQFFDTFQNERAETKALLEERRTLQQALGSTNEELIDEMKKHGITCIKMDSDSADPDTKPLYIRLYENKKRTRPISIKTVGDCIFGKDEEEDEGEENDEKWAQKIEQAYEQVQENLAVQHEQEKKKKTDEKKRMEKRKRKVREIKKRKEEEDAKKLKTESE